MALKAVGFD